MKDEVIQQIEKELEDLGEYAWENNQRCKKQWEARIRLSRERILRIFKGHTHEGPAGAYFTDLALTLALDDVIREASDDKTD
jgi:hypothetical protein